MNKNTKETPNEIKPIIAPDQMTSFDIEKIKEFNDKSVEMIFDDKIDSGLEVFKKIESFLETNAIENKTTFDNKITIIILHNLACCYQKLKDYKNCVTYLEAVIYHFDTSLERKHNIKINCKQFLNLITLDQMNNTHLGDIILELRFSAKFHLQMCAVLSQAGDHIQALSHAKLASLMCEDNIVKTYFLYKQIDKSKNKNDKDKEYPKFEEKIKQSEAIIKALYEKVVSLRKVLKNKDKIVYNDYYTYRNKEIEQYTSHKRLNEAISKIYGVIQKDDWIQLLNIGTIMYLSAFTYDDLDLESDPKYELLRDAILEKTVMLTVSYFCIATEMRLIKNSNVNCNGSFWHKKAVEYSCEFLPVSCPIIRHYITSFDKHYGSSLVPIPENETINTRLDLWQSRIEVDKDPVIFGSFSKVTLQKLRRVISKKNNDYDVINNKFFASMTKLKEDKAPKFKLNFFNIKKGSSENIYKTNYSDRVIKDKSNSERMKINQLLTNNCTVYNANTQTNLSKKHSDFFEKANRSSREKKLDGPCQTHRHFNVQKKELLINTSNSAQGKTVASRIFSKTKSNYNKSKKTMKLANGSNQVTLVANNIYSYNKPLIEESGFSLIEKLFPHNSSKLQSSNVSYNSTSSSLNSLFNQFQLPKKIKYNY